MSDIYCGIEEKIPKGKRRGTAKECWDKKQVRYHGIKGIKPDRLEQYKQGNVTAKEEKIDKIPPLEKLIKDIPKPTQGMTSNDLMNLRMKIGELYSTQIGKLQRLEEALQIEKGKISTSKDPFFTEIFTDDISLELREKRIKRLERNITIVEKNIKNIGTIGEVVTDLYKQSITAPVVKKSRKRSAASAKQPIYGDALTSLDETDYILNEISQY